MPCGVLNYESRLARVQLRTCGASAKRGHLARTFCALNSAGGLRSLSCLSTGRALFGGCSLNCARQDSNLQARHEMQTHWAARFAWLHTSYYAPRLPISPRAQFKEHQPRRVSLKPSPELLRCRAGAIPDEQRDGSLPVKLVAVAEASGQRKTRRRGNALRASLWKVLHRIAVRTRAVKAKREHLASEIIPARGLPYAIDAATRAAQRASMCGISSSACQARQSRRGLRSRMG